MRWFRRREPSPPAVQPSPSPMPAADPGDFRSHLPVGAEAHLRTAYIPQTTAAIFGTGSGFGGHPHLAPGVDHPVCPNCRQPMPLLAQLDLDSLPAAARPGGDGLLQAFYCDGAPDAQSNTQCDVDLEGWAAFSRASVVRLVPSTDGVATQSGRAHPARRVDRWEAYERDLPNWEEARELGMEYPDDFADVEGLEITKGGDKLGGWPAWVQSLEYPDCPRCGARMALVLQIDSEDNVPVMFGDVGTGHVTQCPAHPDVLAFAWACT